MAEMTKVIKSLKDLKNEDIKTADVDMDQVKKILSGETQSYLYSFQSTLAGEVQQTEANVIPFLSGHDLEELKASVRDQFTLKQPFYLSIQVGDTVHPIKDQA